MDYIVPYKIQNKMNTLPTSAITLNNEIGQRFDVFCHNRVSGEFAVKEILGEAERFFVTKLDDELGAGMWRGEFYGKLILSAVRVARMKGDENLKAKLGESVHRLIENQEEDGYLSTYLDGKNIFGTKKDDLSWTHIGWDSNWNVWCQKYTLWALLECAMLLDDEVILNSAKRLADNLISTVEELGVAVRDLGVQQGMAAGSILKPILLLYRLTGDDKYLAFAKKIADEWDDPSGKCPNLILNSINKIPVYNWYSRDEGWSSKAYEMMSCFDGICELYRITGEERLLLATESFADLLIEYESNVLGSVGYCEKFANAAAYPDAATEICDVIHWMRLCHELFLITGKIKYIEHFESAFLNAFLAGVYPSEGWGAFFVRSHGRHWSSECQCDGKYQHCCVNNIPRGFVNAAETVITESNGDYYINTYIPTTVTLGGVTFHIGAGYLNSGVCAITVRGLRQGSKVYLRAPEWSKKTLATLYHEGGEVELVRGDYTPITITKENSVIRLSFDMTPHILAFEREFPKLEPDDYHVYRWSDMRGGRCNKELMLKAPMCTLRRGPLILARSKVIGSCEEEMFSGDSVFGKEIECSATDIFQPGLIALVRVTLRSEGEEKSFLMCDLASAQNSSVIDTARYFSIFI